MSYIGRNINNLSDRAKLDSISTSATATFNLLLNSVAYVPSSAESLTVSLNGVIQAPQSSYTVSGSTIVFASNLASSDVIDFILAERAITLTTIGSGTVTTSNIVDANVTTAKIADNAVTSAKLASGAGGDPNLALSCSFSAYMNTAITNASINSLVSLPFDAEDFDLGNNFNTSTYTFTAPATGYYLFNTHVRLNTNDRSMDYIMLRLVTNSLTYERNIWDPNAFYSDVTYWSMNSTDLIYLPSGNTISPKYYQGGGNAMVDIPSGASGARFSGMRVA